MDSSKISDSSSSSEDGSGACSEACPPACAADDGLERLLEQRRNDVMFELRRLKMGEKPVTNGEMKKTIERFFERNAATNQRHWDAGGLNSDMSDQRPESVTIEVSGLISARPVSSLLQSVAFRRNLERVVRGVMSGGGATVHAADRTRSAIRTDVALSESAAARETASAGSLRAAATERSPNAAPIATQSSSPGGQSHVQEWIGQHAARTGQARLEHFLDEQQQENLVGEISELLHRHIVSSTLGGEFRYRLESSMQERVQRSGTDGARVQQFVQSLRPTGIIRNDFSNLGIPQPTMPAAEDQISVVSTLTATIPFAQSNAAVVREMHSLREQLAEMKNMMKISFDLQLDIQRSIRQEVAAALACAMSGVAGSLSAFNTAPGGSSSSSVPAGQSKCLACLDASADAVLYRCGHMCMCYSCCYRLKQQQPNGFHCPVCRAPVLDVVRAYRVE